MTVECERERVIESALDGRLAERAALGWRLVSAVQHHFQTEEESPVWILFWERVT